MIHLDTSFVVDLLREAARGSEGPASRLLGRVQDQELGMSVFVACELAAGAAMATKPVEEKRKVERLCSGLSIHNRTSGSRRLTVPSLRSWSEVRDEFRPWTC